MNLGTVLRRHRKEKGMTLREVAEKSGVSEGFLSQVENNVKSPSVETLMSIGGALHVSAGDLLNQLLNQEQLAVVHKKEWEEVDLPHTGFATRRFFPPENRTVIDSAVIFLAGGKSIPVRRNVKNSQEILCVLAGTLELQRGGNRVDLSEGDSVHLWTDPKDQRVTNVGNELAVVLWVGTI
jgi:transcriptional regulator with XRE-family HTH domain